MSAAPGVSPRTILIALYIKYNGDWDKMFRDITNKSTIDVQTYLAGIDVNDYVTIVDKEYNDDLRYLTDRPPFVIDKRKMRRW